MLKPDVMGYVLFLPAFILFVFPLLFLPLLLLGGRLNAGVRLPAAKTVAEDAPDPFPAHDKRQSPRQGLDGIIALVSDGSDCCRVSVNDISSNGICFACSGNRLNQDSDNLGVLLTGAGKSIHMQVKPQWKLRHGAEQDIGATIVATLGNWQEFADGFKQSRSMHAG
ncbi:MAG: hypothetical protein RBR09_10405 [Desulfobulbaceae bacterium]|jgi:hypothetical protein|nr:hypothetical protein [Desulfobulbaceae bacterium]MDY0351653.1 hypothetical protein [Desulfobulbaceae bacterium]